MERQSVSKTIAKSHSGQPLKGGSVTTAARHPMLGLQQSIGNRAIQRLLSSHNIQAKLHVGAPNDPYEQEADRVADTVMRMADSQAVAAVAPSTPISRVNRKCSECEEEEMLQGKTEAGDQLEVSGEVETQLNTLRGSGQPLPESVRAHFEPRFGHDFSSVRVHTGAEAARVARSINAKAFTMGRDVAFGAGQYAPRTEAGQRLIAHELTHVVQQTADNTRVQRRTDVVRHQPTRPNARACLVHLHGDERNARAVADSIYSNYCVNFAYIDHPGRRYIRVDVPGHGVTCSADPNRIFDDTAITNQWNTWNGSRSGCRADPVKSAAQRAVQSFRDNELCPAIRECRGQAASPGVCTQVQGLPTAAFHNNTPGAPLTIHEYQAPRGRFRNETETDSARLTDPSTTPPTVLTNPHVEPQQDPDNVVLTTTPDDFRFFVRRGRNVVLQKLNPPNDGSLSVALSTGRYINIEAELPTTNPASNLPVNLAMGEEAMAALGIPRGPCPASPTPAPAGAQSQTGPNTTATPAPTSQAPTVRRSVAVTHRAPGVQMQQITSADLATQTTPDLDGFMRHVFDLQVQMWTSQGVPYVHELPGNELANLPASDTAGRAVQLRRNVAAIVHNMLEAARRDLSAARASGDPTARGVRRLAVKSGYRSAPTQLSIWERMFPRYYRETQTQRQAMTGGEHGPEAARFLANYFNVRVHSPGYSQHQRGQTVDLTFDQRGWIEPDSDPANITRWRNSWFFGWLSSHAWEYGFVQNPTLNEPWHWEFEEGLYMLSMLVQQIEQLIRRIVELIRNIAGALGRSDERPTQQSG